MKSTTPNEVLELKTWLDEYDDSNLGRNFFSLGHLKLFVHAAASGYSHATGTQPGPEVFENDLLWWDIWEAVAANLGVPKKFHSGHFHQVTQLYLNEPVC